MGIIGRQPAFVDIIFESIPIKICLRRFQFKNDKNMRTYLVLCALCLSSLVGFGQKLEIVKASPFTAVKWENEKTIVRFDNEWYTLEKLDKYSTKELLDFCKLQFGDKWQKRFSEDLVDVLKEMGSPPEEKVKLVLSNGKEVKNVIGTYTFENRQKVFAHNKISLEN